MSNQSRKQGNGVLVVVALVVFVMAAAGAYYVTGMYRRGSTGRAVVTRRPVVTLSEQGQVKLYLPKDSKWGPYLATQTRMVELKGTKLDAALGALTAAGQGKGEAPGLVPEGTKALSPVSVKGRVATVNFSKEFQDNFSGGSDQESLTLNSIAHTVVSNSDGKAKAVRILVEGAPVESLGGHYDLREPIEPDSTLLKPAEAD